MQLEWGDYEEEAYVFEENEEGSESELEVDVEVEDENFSLNPFNEESSPYTNEGRDRRRPA